MYVYTYTIYICISVYIYICIYIYVNIYMYTHTHTHTHTHIHTHTYTHTHTLVKTTGRRAHPYAWHDSFVTVTCLLLACDMTHSHPNTHLWGLPWQQGHQRASPDIHIIFVIWYIHYNSICFKVHILSARVTWYIHYLSSIIHIYYDFICFYDTYIIYEIHAHTNTRKFKFKSCVYTYIQKKADRHALMVRPIREDMRHDMIIGIELGTWNVWLQVSFQKIHLKRNLALSVSQSDFILGNPFEPHLFGNGLSRRSQDQICSNKRLQTLPRIRILRKKFKVNPENPWNGHNSFQQIFPSNSRHFTTLQPRGFSL